MAFNFFDELKKIQNNKKVLTENGAVSWATTGKALLDLNFKVASYRNKSEQEIVNDFLKAYAEDPELAVKWMFYVGDVREGLGERRLFRTLIKQIVPRFKHLIPLIAEYNRYDSLFELFGTDAEADMIEFVKTQLKTDLLNLKANKPVSLLGKWLPSINTSSAKTRALAQLFANAFNMNARTYRKTLSALRKGSNVLETQLCANDWHNVNYETVPSKANLKYKFAFLMHDGTRRREFLGKLEKGEVKINSGVLYPHDIANKYRGGYNRLGAYDATLEGLWKNLPNMVDASKPVIVVRDGSGSMTCKLDHSSQTTALDIATALAIYFAEHTSDAYKDQFITFSEHPKYISLKGLTSLHDKLVRAYQETECANTNIEAVFDLLLDVAKKNGVRQEEIPTVLIVSDMEFDGCAVSNNYSRRGSVNRTLFENIAAKWKRAGYILPRCVFWNVNSRTGAIPVRENEAGVALVSGFSANICKMVCSNELDPYKALKEILLAERYAKVTIK